MVSHKHFNGVCCGGLSTYIFVRFVVYIIKTNYHEEHEGHEEEYKGTPRRACTAYLKNITTEA